MTSERNQSSKDDETSADRSSRAASPDQASRDDSVRTGDSTAKRALVALKRLRRRYESLQDEHESLKQRQSAPVAVIGMGCRFPGGATSPESYWELLSSGTDAITDVPEDRWDADALYDENPGTPGRSYATKGGFLDRIDTFDANLFGIGEAEARAMDPQQRLLLEVTWEALERAGHPPRREDGDSAKTGVFVGLSTHDYSRHHIDSSELTRIDPYSFTGAAFSVASGRIAYLLNLHGPTLTVDTACSSSLVALHLACRSLRSDECRTAVAGGANALIRPENQIYFSKTTALSPTGRCHTFSEHADGYVRAEGCGVVVLKRLSDALEDGDAIRAVIRGSAVNHDGKSNGLTAPNGVSQRRVLRDALNDANLSGSDLQYVEAHGTGTPLGDPIELQSLSDVLGPDRSEDAPPCFVGSCKTNVGHMEAAAGVGGLIKTVLALQHDQIPPSLHSQPLNTRVDWDALPMSVPTSLEDWPGQGPQRAGVSAFGFSGTNAHVVLEAPSSATAHLADSAPTAASGSGIAPDSSAPTPSPADRDNLLVLSAQTKDRLRVLASSVRSFLSDAAAPPLHRVAYTLQTGRTHLTDRLAVMGSTVEEVRRRLGDVLDSDLQTSPADANWLCGTVPQSPSGPVPDHQIQSCAAQDDLHPLAEAWVDGRSVDWSVLWACRSDVPPPAVVPTYPFRETSYWMDPPASPSSPDAANSAASNQADVDSTGADQSGTRASGEAPSDSPAGGGTADLLAFVQRQAASLGNLDIDRVRNSSSLSNLDLGSIALLKLRYEIEDVLNRDVSTSVLLGSETWAELTDRLSRRTDTSGATGETSSDASTDDDRPGNDRPSANGTGRNGPGGDGAEGDGPEGDSLASPTDPTASSGSSPPLVSPASATKPATPNDPAVSGDASAPRSIGPAAPTETEASSGDDHRSASSRITPDLENRHEPFPLTDLQESFFAGKVMGPESERIGGHAYVEIDEPGLEVPRLEDAWNRLVSHHDMLRAVVLDDGQQQIQPTVPHYDVPVHDLRGAAETELDAHWEAVRTRLSHKVYQPGEWPLFTVEVTAYGDDRFRIHTSIDEWVIDGFSLSMLLGQWEQLYRHPSAVLPSTDLSFRDYVLGLKDLEESPRFQRDLDFWMTERSPLPPGPDLPYAEAEPGSRSRRRRRLHATLDAEAWTRLRKRAEDRNVSPTALLLTVYAEVLRYWSDSRTTFSLILTFFNRLPLHPDVDRLIGLAVSTVLFTAVDDSPSPLGERVQAYQSRLWDNVDHTLTSSVRVLREMKQAGDLDSDFTVPVVFTSMLENFDPAGREEGWSYDWAYGITQTPQVLLDHSAYEQGDTLRLQWDVATDYFEEDAVDAMFDHYQRVIQALAEAEAPMQVDPSALRRPTGPHRALPDASSSDAFPLTDVQVAYSYGRMSGEPEGTVILQEMVVDDLDVDRLRSAWQDLVGRHGMLRAVVSQKGTQTIRSPEEIDLSQAISIREVAPGDFAAAVRSTRARLTQRVFELDAWPLHELVVTQRSSGPAVVQLAVDLLVADSRSIYFLARQLARCLADPTYLPVSPKRTFADYVASLSGRDENDAASYWREKIATLPPGPNLPQPSDPDATTAGSRHTADRKRTRFEVVISDPSTLHQLCERASVPLPSILLALYAEVLAAYSSRDRFTIVVPSFDRPGSTDWDGVVGDFSNLSWVERIPDPAPFEEKARQMHAELVADRAQHPTSGLPALRHAARNGEDGRSFPVVFTHHLFDTRVPGGQSVRFGEGRSATAGVSLDASCARGDDGLHVHWDAAPSDFQDGVLETLFDAFTCGLTYLAENVDHGQTVDLQSQIEALSADFAGDAPLPVRRSGHDRTLDVGMQDDDAGPPSDAFSAPSAPPDSSAEGRPPSEELEPTENASLQDRLDAHAEAYVLRAFDDLDVLPPEGETVPPDTLRAQAGIEPRYDRLMHRLVSHLAKCGFLIPVEDTDGAAYRSVPPATHTTPESSSLPTLPADRPEVELLKRCGEALPAVLTGEADATNVLFPDGDPSLLARLYSQPPEAQVTNRMIRTAVEDRLDSQGNDAPLRILEVGAGTGGTAGDILPALPGADGLAEYVFTDVSSLFLHRARTLFDDVSCMSFATFDVEQPPQSQEIAAYSFDIVIASNVLHATSNLDQTLDNLRAALRSGGELLLNEVVKPALWLDLTFGLTDGWWRYSDPDRRTTPPLLSDEEWRARLSECGFSVTTAARADLPPSQVASQQAVFRTIVDS